MMTREEARIELQAMKDTFEEYEPGGTRCQMAIKVALSALRPVSRERVEGMYSDCSECSTCKLCIWNETKRCNNCHSMSLFKPLSNFCPKCGKPLTDEAVQMMMERLEALKDGNVE